MKSTLFLFMLLMIGVNSWNIKNFAGQDYNCNSYNADDSYK